MAIENSIQINKIQFNYELIKNMWLPVLKIMPILMRDLYAVSEIFYSIYVERLTNFRPQTISAEAAKNGHSKNSTIEFFFLDLHSLTFSGL